MFDTPHGVGITKGISTLADKLNLTFNYGTVPQDYYMTRCVRGRRGGPC